MASAKEISQYLKRFSQLDAKRFAVVKVGGAVLRDDLEALTSSLSFLQEVGLTPIVLHGAGPQLDTELSAAGIEKHTVNGLRVTTPEALAIVRRVFQSANLELVEALQRNGARATSITGGVFEADYLDRDTYGLVGEVNKVNLAPIEASLRAGSIPVIASLGETAGGQILNVNADFAANELVCADGIVGVDHPSGRPGQGTVHPQGLGHPGPPRRARAHRHLVGRAGPGADEAADRIQLRP